MLQIAVRRAVAPSAAGPAARTAAPVVAAVLSLGAAWVHLAYTASHLRQWWAYGAFFLATGAGQALFAPLVLRRPRPWVAAVGIAGNLAIVAMYVLSRTAGPPLGPHAHVPEPAGAVDLATTAVEVALVGVLLTLLGGRSRRWVANLLLGGGVLLWALRLSGTLP
ncbi:MAG: hypothetical protein QOH72_1282 [Solirubrobacteraceae bacterium]|nr:hypothetical protein [Solirubrobacteraceae bacterium]